MIGMECERESKKSLLSANTDGDDDDDDVDEIVISSKNESSL